MKKGSKGQTGRGDEGGAKKRKKKMRESRGNGREKERMENEESGWSE